MPVSERQLSGSITREVHCLQLVCTVFVTERKSVSTILSVEPKIEIG